MQRVAHSNAESSAGAAIEAINPPRSEVATGLLGGALEGQDEDSDGDGDGDDDSKDGSDVKLNGELKKGNTDSESTSPDH